MIPMVDWLRLINRSLLVAWDSLATAHRLFTDIDLMSIALIYYFYSFPKLIAKVKSFFILRNNTFIRYIFSATVIITLYFVGGISVVILLIFQGVSWRIRHRQYDCSSIAWTLNTLRELWHRDCGLLLHHFFIRRGSLLINLLLCLKGRWVNCYLLSTLSFLVTEIKLTHRKLLIGLLNILNLHLILIVWLQMIFHSNSRGVMMV